MSSSLKVLIVNCQNNNKVFGLISFEINSISINSSSLREKIFPSSFIDEIFLM